MNERTYNNEEILWKIDIPDGWKVMSIDKLTSLRDKGNKMIEDLGGKISEQAQTTLINFQKTRPICSVPLRNDIPRKKK